MHICVESLLFVPHTLLIMNSFDAHHHHHHHHHHHQHLVKETINRQPNASIFHPSLFDEPNDQSLKKVFRIALIMVVGFVSVLFFVVSLALSLCPNKGNSISASVSLAKADDYHNSTAPSTTTTFIVFNVHIELTAYDGETRYGNTTAFLRHPNGTDIDEFPIAGARIGFGATRDFNVPLRMVSRHHLFNGSDPLVSCGGGVVMLQTHVRFSGKVWWTRARPVNEVNCDLLVYVENRTLAHSECKPMVSCKAKAA